MFAPAQPHDSFLLTCIDDYMKTSEPFHSHDHTAVDRFDCGA
jgi:hypothetical protein